MADARQVNEDAQKLTANMRALAHEISADDGARFAGPDRMDVSYLLRWLCDGNFVLLGALRCAVADGESTPDDSSRLGVARLRTETLPELSRPGELVVLAQATMPSFLRYGAYPYIVVVREQTADGPVIEHRFVGLFTVAAMNANVLDILLISRRVQGALTMCRDDPGTRSADARHHADHPALGVVQSHFRATAEYRHRGVGPRFAPPDPAVPARRPARPLRVLPGLPFA